jgi:hypothetical protein
MPGIVYRALPKTTYDFAATAVGATTTYVVAKGIDVSQFREGTLVVRIHSGSQTGGSGTAASVTVQAFADAPTAEDPALDFEAAAACATTGAITAFTTTGLTLVNLTTPFGGSVRVKVSGTQRGTTVATTFLVTISVDIVAKS